jgi:hypothetical protein
LKAITLITVVDKDIQGADIELVDTAVKSQQTGLEPLWSLPGAWGAVAADDKAGVLYASSQTLRGGTRRSDIDAQGKILRDVSFPAAPVWRLAHFSGVAAPVLLMSGAELFAWTLDGTRLWSYSRGTSADDFWPADLDGDHSDEVVVGYNGSTGLDVLDSTGKPLWTYPGIGNVWHVSGGDIRGNGKAQVVTTSSAGKVHLFNDAGTAKIDLDPGVYATMVRVGRIHPTDVAATIFAGGTTSDNTMATLTAILADGTKKWSLPLQAPGRPSLYSMYLAPGQPWLAVGMQTGVVYVVDAEQGKVIATLDGQGLTPELAWMTASAAATPMLVVSTRTGLSAYRVTGR